MEILYLKTKLLRIEDEKKTITIKIHLCNGTFLGFNDKGNFFIGLWNCKLFINPSKVIKVN